MKIATTKNTFFPPHNFFPHLFLSIFSSQPKLKQRFRENDVYHYGGRVVLPRFLSAWVSLQPREWRWEPIPSICVSVCVCVCAWGWVLFYRWMSILCNESHPRGHCNIVLKEGKLLTVVLRFCVHTKHNMLQPRKEVCTLLPIARVWIDGMTTTGPKHLPLTKWPAIAKMQSMKVPLKLESVKLKNVGCSTSSSAQKWEGWMINYLSQGKGDLNLKTNYFPPWNLKDSNDYYDKSNISLKFSCSSQ